MQKYNTENEKYHKIDEISVEILIKECEQLNYNPIILFKKQGSPHSILDTEDFMIIIITKGQEEVLTKFSPKLICIDSTHSTNAYDFQLTTIIIHDEFEEGFPVCYCISSKVNEVSMIVLFEEIKKNIGIISTIIFMSDDARVYYNTWKKIMSEVKYKLLCKWHIDRAWKKNFNLMTNNNNAKFMPH